MIRTVGPGPRGIRGYPPVLPSPFSRALDYLPLDRPPATVIGLEQEYSLSRARERVDFRHLIHDLPVAGSRLDPGDANAYRTPSGLVVTCDAEDAEVVSPPVDVRPGIAADIARWADHGQAELFRLLPTGIMVSPFSTHLSASMPDRVATPAADLFARTFAPALMLLLDRADSHGVFVRPRPGRLEVCGEHATGPRLGAAAVLVAGGARACAAALGPLGGGEPHLLPLLAVDVRPASGRPGLFVGRHLAFGYDFYAAGRRAAIPLSSGGTIGAQAYLDAAWHAARDALGSDVGAVDLGPGDAMIAGSLPLGVEEGAAPPAVPPPRPPSMPASPFGDLLQPRRRPSYGVTPVAATWDFTVFRLAGAAREAFACVPGPQLGAFLERLDAGRLDELLSASLDADPTASVLVAHEQTAVPRLWDRVVIGPDLLPYERTEVDPVAPVPAFGVHPPPTYVRRGKAAVVLSAATEPIRVVPISASSGQSVVAPPPSPRPFEQPPPPAPLPGLRPARRRRPARVGVLVVLLLLMAGSAAAVSGIFAGGEQAEVAVLTGPPSTFTGAVPATTGPTPAPDTEPVATTVAPEAPAPTEPPVTSTVPAVTTAVPRTTTVVTVPAPTPIPAPTPTPTIAPEETTVPVETTVTTATTSTSSTTTTTVPPPTSFVVTVTSGALGCVFQPSSASAVAGSTVRFQNDTGGTLGIAVTTPGAAGTTISLETGSTSAGVSLATAGAYGVTCNSGDGSVVGRMTITVTSG